jgi:hypothetical protein
MTNEKLDHVDSETISTDGASNIVDYKSLEMTTKSQPVDFAKLPKAFRVNLDDLATSIFDPRGGRALVVGYAVTGKTFFIEQFIGHIDRYLEKIEQDKLVFVKLNTEDAIQIEAQPGAWRTYMSNLISRTGLREEEICFVTESFDVANSLSVFGGKCKIIFELSIFTFEQIRRMEASGKSKTWFSWQNIDLNFMRCTKDEIATLLYESLSTNLEKSFNVKILKKDILMFINYCLKNIPELLQNAEGDKKKIIVPPGVWAAAITRLAGAMAFASDEDLHNSKTGQKIFGRVVAKIFNEVRNELEEYLNLNDDDDEAMEGFIPEFMEGMGLTFVRGTDPSASPEGAETPANPATTSHLVFGDFETLTERLESEVIGQSGAVESVVEGLLVPAAGLNDSTKPIRSMMFLGPTGVGKTKLALTLAAELMIDPLNVVRLDMSEYSQQNEAVKLFGAPPGYVGHGQGGALTTPVEKNPRSLILLDEVEKAHPLIWDSFLQVFDSGRMTTGAGKVVDFSQTVIVMTSNLGSRELARKSAGFLIGHNSAATKSDTEIQNTILKEVEQFFKPEMINRIDDLIIFKDLSLETTRKIVSKEIDLVRHRANLAGYALEEPSDDIIEAILQKTDVSKYGARQIQRTVLKYISNPIARSMLKKADSSMDLSLVINDNQEISVLEK